MSREISKVRSCRIIHKNKVTERREDPLGEHESLLKDVPLELAVRIRTVISESHSGPLPQAEQFEQYGKVSPGAAKEILGMAREEQQIRKMIIGLERCRINAATLVSFGMIGLAGIGMVLGVSGSIVVLLGLSGMITFFLREFSNLSSPFHRKNRQVLPYFCG